MGYTKEPPGVDFLVDPTPLTRADRKRISNIIAHYKATGSKILPKKNPTAKTRLTSTGKKKVLE